MRDLIDRELLLKEIEQTNDNIGFHEREIMDCIKYAETVYAPAPWRDVDVDPLPECSDQHGISNVVWCADSLGRVGFGIYCNENSGLMEPGWFTGGGVGDGSRKITHWMPIPKPPRGGNNA